ncbi:hypothetical protein HPB52_022338 [Rhipicephalus sanguineus]|uniref:Tick transposon n=1 Tax=Rhipicephalus sanguineus TaxID=34632 RepID=A0A9D4Q423_RHISA|nr:hypothetical protein HPB52_022338 [Rhipicephalus sanguineus]
MLPIDKRFPTKCSLYADDVPLLVRGPRPYLTAIRRSLQRSLDAVTSFFRTIELIVSPTKTEELLGHLKTCVRRLANPVEQGADIPMAKNRSPPHLDTNRRTRDLQGHQGSDCCGQAVEQGPRVHPATGTPALQGGCNGSATYALLLVQLAPHRKEQLKRQYRMAFRCFMGLPRQSPVADSLAEVKAWPLSLLMLRQALHHVYRLHKAPEGDALLRRLRSRPASRVGQISELYEELVPDARCPIQPPPLHQQPLDVHLELDNFSKRRIPVCELRQSAVAKLHDRVRGNLLVFTDGFVRDNPRLSAAACVHQRLGPPSGATFHSTPAPLQQN